MSEEQRRDVDKFMSLQGRAQNRSHIPVRAMPEGIGRDDY